MNSLFLMRTLSPTTLSHSVFLSHSICVCSSSVVRMRSPLGRPRTATTCPLFPVLLSCSVSSRCVRTSAYSVPVTMISLLCRPGTGFSMTLAVNEEVAFLATAAYEGFCCRVRVLLSTFKESCCTASWSVRIAFAVVY
jgi:hypothetical protein